MIIGVTGSRDWDDAGAIRRSLAAVQDGAPGPDMLLIHGKCPPRTPRGAVIGWNKARLMPYRQQVRLRGADWLAWVIAAQLGWKDKGYPAQWQALGGGAGFARNTEMVNDGGAQIWLAFINACATPGEGCPLAPHGSHGGADCFAKIQLADIPYILDRRGW